MEAVATSTKTAMGYIETWAGTIRVETSAQGVQQVWLPDWHERPYGTMTMPPGSPLAGPVTTPDSIVILSGSGNREAEHVLRQALVEVAEYFNGARRTFAVPLDLSGPVFFRRVWAEVAKVPYGETRSYQEIAETLGTPRASRAVGAANGANPVAPFVCCQRIVGSDGSLTGYGPGLPLKERLLAMEDAIPGGPTDYPAWVQRVAERLGTASWVLGLRRRRRYCEPLAAPAALRMLPNRLFATEAKAEAAGYARL
jgi:O-6-methylguanine DNA methyltransferase